MEIIANKEIHGSSYSGDTVGQGIALEPGVVGKALHVGDINSYVNLGPIRNNCFGSPALCPKGYTLALWLKRKQSGSNPNYYISNGGQTSASYGINIYGFNAVTIGIWLKTTTKLWKLFLNVPEDIWYHVLFTWSESNGLFGYINGTLQGMVTVPVPKLRPTTTFNDFVFGISNRFCDRGGVCFIDEMLFWDAWKPAQFVNLLFASYQQNTKAIITSMFQVINEEPIGDVEPARIAGLGMSMIAPGSVRWFPGVVGLCGMVPTA